MLVTGAPSYPSLTVSCLLAVPVHLYLSFQALSSFSSALQSGELGPLMTQFGLGEDVSNAAAKGGKQILRFEKLHETDMLEKQLICLDVDADFDLVMLLTLVSLTVHFCLCRFRSICQSHAGCREEK